MTLYVVPVIASIGGILILDEQFIIGMVVGMILIVGGISLINRQSQQVQAKPI